MKVLLVVTLVAIFLGCFVRAQDLCNGVIGYDTCIKSIQDLCEKAPTANNVKNICLENGRRICKTNFCEAYPFTQLLTCADGSNPKILPATIIGCSASSTYSWDYNCNKALQGPYQRENNYRAWASKGQTVGAWIQLNFNVPTVVKMVRIIQRYNMAENARRVRFDYSGENVFGEEFFLYHFGSYAWNNIRLYRDTPTHSLRITVKEVTPFHGRWVRNVGFKAIQIIGCQ